MTLKEMRNKVLEEMEHIDRHPKAEQGELRMAYFAARMNSLGKKAKGEKTAFEVLQECIELLKRDRPHTEFRYDKPFFQRRSK